MTSTNNPPDSVDGINGIIGHVHTQDCGTQTCSSCVDDKAKKEVKEIKVKMPSNVKAGDTVTVTVSNGSGALVPTPPASSMPELLDNMKKGYLMNQIVVRISTAKKIFYYRGKELSEIPSSQLSKILGGEAVIWQSFDYKDTVFDTPYILAHSFATQIKVK